MKRKGPKRAVRKSREEQHLDREEKRHDHDCEIAMHVIASFYSDDKSALKLLREFVAKSPSKYAAQAAIALHARLEVARFQFRKKNGWRLEEQGLKILERALFPRTARAKPKGSGVTHGERRYNGKSRY